MKRIVFATVALLSFAGIAAAQQAPFLQGNYDAAVKGSYNSESAPKAADVQGIRAVSITRDGSASGGYGLEVNEFEVRSGR
jgi:hypothetical protein